MKKAYPAFVETKMTRLQAHEILDRQKRGFLCLPSEVSQALWVTGDTRGDFVVSSDGMEKTIHRQDEDLGETQSLFIGL